MPSGASPAAAPFDQAAAVPYCIRGSRIELCMITSIRSGRWGIPKGLIDPGETPEETAAKEALEEAGLTGRIVSEPLGSYRYRKWGRHLSVVVYLMEVTAEEDRWDEADLRERRWVGAREASQLTTNTALRTLIEVAVKRIEDARAADL